MVGKLKLALALLGCVCIAETAVAESPTFESIAEAAKAEGGLVVRLSSPGKPETLTALMDAFNKRFGLSVQVDWAPANAPATNTRVITEAASGRGSIDIIGLGSAEDVATLVDRDLVVSYPWIEVFGNEFAGLEKAVDSVLPDLKNYALPVLDAVYGLAWNPAMVDEATLPKTTVDLLDPKWAGKIALNSSFLNPLPSMSYIIGADATREYAEKLLNNKPVLEQGTPAVSRAISVGQVPFGVTTYHAALRTLQNGEPQKFRLFEDYVFIFEGYGYIPENAPNPNTARLFLAWLVTDGNKIAGEFEAMPLVSDSESAIGKMVAAQQANTNAKIATPRSLVEIRATNELRQTISKMISGQVAK